MPRPKRIRKMTNPPHFKGFKPIGIAKSDQPVVMGFEEYEAIRLCDFELMGQVAAAQVMEVSRPTFTRIYESARRKVAQAFVLGKPIVFEGGKVYFDSHWFTCNNCGCWFDNPETGKTVGSCALCGSTNFEQYTDNKEPDENQEDVCICPECGDQKRCQHRATCKQDKCPRCNQPMVCRGSFNQ
jgi:uncharacterized protein